MEGSGCRVLTSHREDSDQGPDGASCKHYLLGHPALVTPLPCCIHADAENKQIEDDDARQARNVQHLGEDLSAATQT